MACPNALADTPSIPNIRCVDILRSQTYLCLRKFIEKNINISSQKKREKYWYLEYQISIIRFIVKHIVIAYLLGIENFDIVFYNLGQTERCLTFEKLTHLIFWNKGSKNIITYNLLSERLKSKDYLL